MIILPAGLAVLTPSSGAPAVTYATWSSTAKSSNITLSSGDLKATKGGMSLTWDGTVKCNQAKSSGKWYFEIKIVDVNPLYIITGLADSGALVTNYIGASAVSGGAYSDGQGVLATSISVTGGWGKSLTTNDVVGCAFDATAKKAWFRKNTEAWVSGDPEAGTSPSLYSWSSASIMPACSIYTVGDAVLLNCGASAFVGTVPSGFNAGVYE